MCGASLILIVAAGVIWLCALATHAFALLADPWPTYLLGAAIFLVDGIYILVYPRLRRSSLAAVRWHVYMQIAVDLTILTALLHFSGGVTNPLALFYLFHAFIAALVLSVRAAVAVAISSMLLLTFLGLSERVGWLPDLLRAMADEAPLLAAHDEGSFMSRVAHLAPAPKTETSEAETGTGPDGKET